MSTRDDIIRMAREAGFMTAMVDGADGRPTWPLVAHLGTGCIVELKRFAALVAAAEREACAQVCEGYGRHQITQHLAYAIRARGAAPAPTFDVSKPATDPVNAPAVQHIREHLLDAARKASCTHVYAPHQPLPDGCATAKCMHCGHEPDTTT